MLKRRLRSEKAWQSLFRTGVRFPSPPPQFVRKRLFPDFFLPFFPKSPGREPESVTEAKPRMASFAGRLPRAETLKPVQGREALPG